MKIKNLRVNQKKKKFKLKIANIKLKIYKNS